MLRYSNVMSVILLSSACFFTLFEYKQSKNREKLVVAHYEMPATVKVLESENTMDSQNLEDQTLHHADHELKSQLVKAETTQTQVRTLQISKGDTVGSLLQSIGFSSSDIELISATFQNNKSVKKLKPGRTLVVYYVPATQTAPHQLVELEYAFSEHQVLLMKRSEQCEYNLKVESNEKKPVLKRVFGQIHSSFYNTALRNGLPAKIVKEAISNLAYVMNFQHGIKRGDSFEILYEEYVDRHGNSSKIGNIRYVGFMAGNTYHRLYRIERNGVAQFFDFRGQSLVRGLLQTPIDPRKMRVTSGFCKNRLHPIKGFRRDHKGVDFGAPTGTEIKAAGDGVITKIGYYGEYGHYVKVKHSGGYETAYGHLSRYASGLKVGSRVAQNQLIGFVGSTGNATGPHLHFEVIHNGVHINPMTVKAMPILKLVGKDLEKFKAQKRDLETHIVGLTTSDSNTKAIG